jgi:putative LysE/RhtB family amino acid efflux pump
VAVTERSAVVVGEPSLTDADHTHRASRVARGDIVAAMGALAVGYGMGLFVAAQLGPLSLFLIRSVLRGSLRTGLAIGAGIAVIDTLYAAAGAAGAAPVLTVHSVRVVFGLAGAAVLALLGLRTLRSAFRVRLGGEADEEVATPRRAFVTALAATASNPLTIASWAALFAAASMAGAADTPATAVALLAGVGLGSLSSVTAMAVGVSLARRWVGPRLLHAVDACAGTGLLGFAGVLGWRAVRDG